MQTEDDSPAIPMPPVPGGTRWIKITSPHPGQVIKVKKSNDLSVFYVQERPGTSQGRVNGTHRSDRHNFLRDYEPYTKRDWTAAQKLMATLDQTIALPEAAADEPVPVEVEVEVEPTNGQTVMPADDSPEQGEEQEVSEITQAVEEAAEEAAKRRYKIEEFSQAERDEIIGLWHNGESVTDIANTYNTLPPAIYGLLKGSPETADEYWLQRIVDHLTKHGPVPAYQISQWMHLKKEQVQELCTSEAAQRVLLYEVVTNDPSRPWQKTPMVSLLPKTSVAPPEPPAETPEPPAPEEEPVTTATNNTEVPVTETPETLPARPLRQWRVMIRTTVEDKVVATDIAAAIDMARAKYSGKPSEVVGVMEE